LAADADAPPLSIPTLALHSVEGNWKEGEGEEEEDDDDEEEVSRRPAFLLLLFFADIPELIGSNSPLTLSDVILAKKAEDRIELDICVTFSAADGESSSGF